MNRSFTIVQTLIASVLFQLLSTPTNAGVVVEDGIVKSFTYVGELTDPNSPTTVYFYEGSYNTQVTTGVNFTIANNTDPYLTANGLLADLQNYTETIPLDDSIGYSFDSNRSVQDDREVDVTYYDPFQFIWLHDNVRGVLDNAYYDVPGPQASLPRYIMLLTLPPSPGSPSPVPLSQWVC